MNINIVDDTLKISIYKFWNGQNNHINCISLIIDCLRYGRHKNTTIFIPKYLNSKIVSLVHCLHLSDNYEIQELENIQNYKKLEMCYIYNDEYDTFVLFTSTERNEIKFPNNLKYLYVNLNDEELYNISNLKNLVYVNIPFLENVVFDSVLDRLKYANLGTMNSYKNIYGCKNLRYLFLAADDIEIKKLEKLNYLIQLECCIIVTTTKYTEFKCPESLQYLKLYKDYPRVRRIDKLICHDKLKCITLFGDDIVKDLYGLSKNTEFKIIY